MSNKNQVTFGINSNSVNLMHSTSNDEPARNSTLQSNKEEQPTVVEARKNLEIKTENEPAVVAVKVSPKFVKTERQIKYLGLVIEKDEE